MGLEAGTHISDLVPTNPIGASDPKSQGDDHLRLIKTALQTDFPNASKPFYFPEFVSKNANYSVLAADQNKLIAGNAGAGAITLTLPTLTVDDDGWSVKVVKIDSSANGVIVGAPDINGALTYTLERQYEMVEFIWSGTVWYAGMADDPTPLRIVTKTATATLTAAEMRSLVLVTPAAATTITPPAATTGAWVWIKNQNGSFAVTFDPPGAVTVDGEATFAIEGEDESVLFVSDGTNWFVAARYPGKNIKALATGNVKRLVIQEGAVAPNSTYDITADEAVLTDTSGRTMKHVGVSVTFNVDGAVGAGAMDEAAGGTTSIEFYLWLISNGTTINAIAHRTGIARPTMPAGYTYAKMIGWGRTNSSGNLLRIYQKDDYCQYVVGTNPSVPEVLDDGAAGTYSTSAPTLTGVSIVGFGPSIAKSFVFLVTNCWKNLTTAGVLLAPNTAWGGGTRGPLGAAGVAWPVWLPATVEGNAIVELSTETANTVAWASSAAGGAVMLLGWRFPL